jgi:hypothetical protein
MQDSKNTIDESLKPNLEPEMLHTLRKVRNGSVPTTNLVLPGKCNFSCVCCDVQGNPNRIFNAREVMDNSLFALQQLQTNFGLETVHICGEGEPTMYWKLLEGIAEMGLKLNFFTNSSLLTEEKARQLMRWDSVVKFKLNTIDPKLAGEIYMGDKAQGVNARAIGQRQLDSTKLLLNARNSVGKGKIVASIVAHTMNLPPNMPIEMSPLADAIRWCVANAIPMQINYVEELGGNSDGHLSIAGYRELEVIEYMKTNYGIYPWHYTEDCSVLNGGFRVRPMQDNQVELSTGPFGLGCEYGTWGDEIGQVQNVSVVNRADFLDSVSSTRRCQMSESTKEKLIIEVRRKLEEVSSKDYSLDRLPGCGVSIFDINALVLQLATMFSSEDWFSQNSKRLPDLQKALDIELVEGLLCDVIHNTDQ